MRETTRRCSGVLLHITSLPSPRPVGTMGSESFQFIDDLVRAGQSIWQMLPIHPPDRYRSPYSALSAFAGYSQLMTHDDDMPGDARAFGAWHACNRDWVDDWALFETIRELHGGAPWFAWPPPLRDAEAGALASCRNAHAERIGRLIREQFQFDSQWGRLRTYARSKGVRLFGDLPFFVALDSADVWANRHLFEIDRNGRPTHVAGVPPDYFSRTGQRWGNPLYVWAEHARDGYAWWKRRLQVTLDRFDWVRIDHFRAFKQNWAIPARNRTARKGVWREGPGRDLLVALHEVSGPESLVAEDLGAITPSVVALRREFGIPGMAVLQFAFDDEDEVNVHHPDHMMEDVVCYTGTHDNDTTVSWYHETENRRAPHLRRRRKRVQSRMLEGEAVHYTMVRIAMESRARIAVVPMQDVLGLDNDARMNTPGRPDGNWTWRMSDGQMEHVDWAWLARLTDETGRQR